MRTNNDKKIEVFVLDVDGVMTTGHFLYDKYGKAFKVFGPHDADGLKMIRDMVRILFISADTNGESITRARIERDMGYPLTMVSESERRDFILNQHEDPECIAFMGDGYYDALVFPHVGVSLCPINAREECLEAATFVTPSRSGEGAVMDACLYLVKTGMV